MNTETSNFLSSVYAKYDNNASECPFVIRIEYSVKCQLIYTQKTTSDLHSSPNSSTVKYLCE